MAEEKDKPNAWLAAIKKKAKDTYKDAAKSGYLGTRAKVSATHKNMGIYEDK